MMNPLFELCQPRASVFDPQKRDTVLDLNDLADGKIAPAEFFAENYITEGMQSLLKNAFQRLEGKSEQGVYKLRQAMGGGKTHNLLALGLLAQHPQFRDAVMGRFHTTDKALAAVKVIAFSGRESNTPFGVWGALAEQLGKKEHFSDCYSPLQAPGQKAWENLFAGETVLVLLDELPPYFENARAKAIGNSDLAQVTCTALSNLLVAIGRPACARVCLVITDLAAAYARGSSYISSALAALADLEKETHRAAMSLEPVRLNSDELYHILRKRLFEKTPGESDVNDVAQAYAKAIRAAKQMSITSESPEEFAARITASYPFHPGIRDLYARFRENAGFQQTRGLIRLMRIMTARMWKSGAAKKRYLIAAHDLDLNDQETRAEIGQINNTLENAIADAVRAEFNRRLKKCGATAGSWKEGPNLVRRELGKELVLLTWAIEDADPGLTPNAIANWQGLAPEERWWLYTQRAAASGHGLRDRGTGWRKAVRFALTENPVGLRANDEPKLPAFFEAAARRTRQQPLFGLAAAESE